MRHGVLGLIGLVLICLTLISVFSYRHASADSDSIDISWPNCGLNSFPGEELGIIGVNDGLDFSKNPCLSNESQLFSSPYSLYLNTGYPGVSYGLKFDSSPKSCSSVDYLCLAYDYGYNDAVYSLRYADSQDVHSFVWWLDIETENSWTSNMLQNRAALEGMVDAINNQAFMPTIGFYSYPGQWQLLTGSWQNVFPAWVASGSSSRSTAINYCSVKSFSGGAVWLTQYTTSLDYNYNCIPSRITDFKVRLSQADIVKQRDFLLE